MTKQCQIISCKDFDQILIIFISFIALEQKNWPVFYLFWLKKLLIIPILERLIHRIYSNLHRRWFPINFQAKNDRKKFFQFYFSKKVNRHFGKNLGLSSIEIDLLHGRRIHYIFLIIISLAKRANFTKTPKTCTRLFVRCHFDVKQA